MAAIYLLAQLLSPGDFGLANFAVSIGAFALAVPPYVMGDVLIANPGRFDDRSGAALAVVGAAGLLLATFVVLIAEPVESISAKVGAGSLLLFVALRPLSDAFMIVPMARLRLKLAYRRISLIDGVVVLAATVGSVVLAWFGFGPVALVLPPIATLACKGFFYWREVWGEVPLRPRAGEMKPVARAFFVAGLGQYLNNIVAILEVLVLGLFASESELGYFAFAFQLAIQANSIIAGQLGAVLQPIFGRLQGDAQRQALAFMRSTRLLAAVAIPLSLVQAAVARPLFDAVFGEKWCPSIAAFCALSMAQGFMFAAAPAVAMLKAQGNFRTYLALQAGQLLISLLLFVGSLAWWHEPLHWAAVHLGLPMPDGAALPFAISCASAVAWGIFMPLTVWLGCRLGGTRTVDAVKLFVLPAVVSAPFAAVVWFAYQPLIAVWGRNAASWTVTLGLAPSALALAAGACCWVHPQTRADLAALARMIAGRFPNWIPCK